MAPMEDFTVGVDAKKQETKKIKKKPAKKEEATNDSPELLPPVGEEDRREVEEKEEEDGRRSGEVDGKIAVSPDEVVDDGVGVRDDEEGDNVQAPTLSDVFDGVQVKEGRRCGLCGRGHDGKPPKLLIQEPADSENEVYNGLSAAEETNYDMWDGFGDEPDWLGRLLGPIRDQIGITRVWVHQNCAVWSPEVYFAGLGCLKNVRAALCRGRMLKCCRCGRPGATIGCRVDRCPRTYHLPCARADGSIFDHRKFLIACSDHRHLFQPRGELYVRYMKRQKTKKRKLEMRKMWNEAHRCDLEAEEKWLENCGEDEEFLKRESKRLHRDILRIAPIYIGGSSTENTTNFRGWESVAGLSDVICCMKEIVILPLLYPEFFSSMGLTPPRGVLLHGHPGTGKTLVVRALIGECARGNKRIAYFARKGADCLGKYVGDAERQLRLLFQVAEKSQPSIIFFDEIDGLAPCRSKRQDQTHSSVVSTLLSLMDGLKSRGSVIVIGATNRPDAIDPALRRPGRFDREVYFPLPSAKDRSLILSLHTQNWPRPLSGPLLTWVVKKTVGYAGADLQALCTQAAMIALKRNCPLQEILSSVEQGSSGKLPHLPSIVVKESDWLAALSHASPPCSQREAGIAANDIISSPLNYCLLHSLIHPLTQLLASLCFEERIWLPPAILKASKSIRNMIVSMLDQKNHSHLSWMSHLHDLIQDPNTVQEIERNLLCSGLLAGLSSCSHGPDDGTCTSTNEFDSDRENPNGHAFYGKKMHMKQGNPSGFRVLISGSPRSGQQHLAACIIHGFVGHVDVQKINLATMSQEGHGDIVRGLAQLLSKCFSLSRCVIYMPRIDLWVVDEICQLNTDEQGEDLARISGSSNHKINPAARTSQAWDSFVEQLDSAHTSESLIILATSAVQILELPHGVRHFFTNISSSSSNNVYSGHRIPRFSVHVGGEVNPEALIDLAAARLAGELVQQYIQNLYLEIHSSNTSGAIDDHHISCIFSDGHLRNKNCPVTYVNCQNGHVVGDRFHMSHASYRAQQAGEVIEPNETALGRSDPEGMNSNNGSSIKDNGNHGNQANVDVRISPSQKERGDAHDMQVVTPQKHASWQPVTRGMQLGISSLGYQILRFPHFAELCWATSKLKEGPYAKLTMPVKSWPFNSCIMRDSNSIDKAETGSDAKNLIDGKGSGIVRGLLAVGLLAHRGVYTSFREVALEVRKVLELFVGEVNAKISGGKDRIFFHRILSQVAYLEDMVNSWAYAVQSPQVDNQSVVSNINGAPGETTAAECQGHVRSLEEATPPNGFGEIEMQQESERGASERNLDPGNVSGRKPTTKLPEQDSIQVMVSNEEGLCRNERTVALQTRASGKCEMRNDLMQDETSPLLEKSLHDQDLMIPEHHGVVEGAQSPTGPSTFVPSIKNDTRHSDELHKETDCTPSKDSYIPSESEICCSYDCCRECLHSIRAHARELLTSCWRSKGCCTAVDDIVNIVASCSATTLISSLRCQTSKNTQNPSDCSPMSHEAHSRFCPCKDDHRLINGSSILFGSPVECRYSIEATSAYGRVSASGMPSKFVFRNNTIIPLTPPDAKLHCNFSKLCLSSLIPSLLKVRDRANL